VRRLAACTISRSACEVRRQSLPAAISQRAEAGVGCTCPPAGTAPGTAGRYGWSAGPPDARPHGGSSTAVGEEPTEAKGVWQDGEEGVLSGIGVGVAVAFMTRTRLRTDGNRPEVIKSPKATRTWEPVREIPSVVPRLLRRGSGRTPRPDNTADAGPGTRTPPRPARPTDTVSGINGQPFPVPGRPSRRAPRCP
jgi:hypothetical protein